MRQLYLPGFPEGAEKIGSALSIFRKDGIVTYFVGNDNYFSHQEGDRRGERFALANLMANRHVRAIELERSSLCIPHRTLMNWMAQYREAGPGSFYEMAPKQKPRVMTPEKVAECLSLLSAGLNPGAVARRAGIGESTLRKAIERKLIVPGDAIAPDVTNDAVETVGSTKGERSRIDALGAEGIGTACTRADERMAAALGLAQSAATRFEPAVDVILGGLLAGLPALCANGLLSGIGKYLKLPAGFYSCLHILITLGFMALSRIRRPEGLRNIPPGEFGKVIGLDRVPEVRTLREKITIMARTGDPLAWMQELSKAVTAGLGNTLLNDIVPQLLASVPDQPTAEQLASNPQLHRFVLVFDREGATGSLMGKLWEKRIGSITYRKNVKDVWPESEFILIEVVMPDGARTTMKLAMRETLLGEDLSVKEVRRLTQTGHQTAVISTALSLDNVMIASRMFSRWCQENFFAYMMQHYDIDGLVQYGAEDISGTESIINPLWRQLDKEVCVARQQLRKRQAQRKRPTNPSFHPI